MANARFEVLEGREVSVPSEIQGWSLCLQWGEYHYDNGEIERGYRFIWRRPDHSLQSRPPLIPSAEVLFELLRLASHARWFGSCEQEERAAVAA